MSTLEINQPKTEWKNYEKIAFRFFFIYFFIQIIPLDWKFFRDLFSINWLHLNFRNLFNLAHYTPKIFSDGSIQPWGINSFADWGVFFLIALIGATVWSYIDKDKKEYTELYYWLRVLLRYRLAIAVIAFGFIKLFPTQMPYPSLSNLHTNYGDFFAWKIYFHTIGIAPNYESFLGFSEILAGFLLFNRRTVTFGAGIIIGFIGNVAFANVSYELGDHTYTLFLVLIAAFLFAYDIPRLYSLLAKERFTTADHFNPDYSKKWLVNARISLRSAFLFFVLLYGYKTYANYKNGPYLFPQTAGLSKAYGYYNVREFKLNNQVIPYSITDPNRWQNVVFEKWSTLSIRTTRPVKIDLTNGDELQEKDIDRNYELAGVAGRHYYHYDADTIKHKLFLQNKNKNHTGENYLLTYNRVNDSTLVVSGVNEKKDSIYAVLDKVNKKYMMFEGRRKPVKL